MRNVAVCDLCAARSLLSINRERTEINMKRGKAVAMTSAREAEKRKLCLAWLKPENIASWRRAAGGTYPGGGWGGCWLTAEAKLHLALVKINSKEMKISWLKAMLTWKKAKIVKEKCLKDEEAGGARPAGGISVAMSANASAFAEEAIIEEKSAYLAALKKKKKLEAEKEKYICREAQYPHLKRLRRGICLCDEAAVASQSHREASVAEEAICSVQSQPA